MSQGISLILPGLMAALLLYAAWGDLRRRDIPNWLNGAIALVGLAGCYAEGLGPWDFAIRIGIAVIVLLLFTIAFEFGMMGGGDVKMLAALAIWLPFLDLMRVLQIMALAGGVVTIATIIWHRRKKIEGRPEVPYGIAIAFAGLWECGERYLYHFG